MHQGTEKFSHERTQRTQKGDVSAVVLSKIIECKMEGEAPAAPHFFDRKKAKVYKVFEKGS